MMVYKPCMIMRAHTCDTHTQLWMICGVICTSNTYRILHINQSSNRTECDALCNCFFSRNDVWKFFFKFDKTYNHSRLFNTCNKNQTCRKHISWMIDWIYFLLGFIFWLMFSLSIVAFGSKPKNKKMNVLLSLCHKLWWNE